MILLRKAWCFLLSLVLIVQTINTWKIPSFQDIFRVDGKSDQSNSAVAGLKQPCDENRLIYQLSCLYIVSPERIILLLTEGSLDTTCQGIGSVIQNINATLVDCLPMPPSNLYKKLYNALLYFNNHVCQTSASTRIGRYSFKGLTEYHECLQQLREDFIECEGPPDWFEKTNKNIVCQYFNDILNCNYIKTAMLCSIKPALLLRKLSHEIMKAVVPYNCKVPESAPYVDDPMLASYSGGNVQVNVFLFNGISSAMIVHCLMNSRQILQ